MRSVDDELWFVYILLPLTKYGFSVACFYKSLMCSVLTILLVHYLLERQVSNTILQNYPHVASFTDHIHMAMFRLVASCEMDNQDQVISAQNRQ